MSRPELRLRADLLRANIAAVAQRIAPSELMIVTKDDAYGHGLTWTVETAVSAGVAWFGSYDVVSGVRVRRAVGRGPRIFAWVTSTDAEIDEAIRHYIDLGVGSAEYLERVIARASAAGAVARVHLKIDTGLHRNGILPGDWPRTVARIREAEEAGSIAFVGVWSHLAESSDAEDDESHEVFCWAVEQSRAVGSDPSVLHLTASAASWWRPELRGSLSRIGAFCYGVRSADGPDLDGIVPVAELVARVTDVGADTVTIALGSFDGLPSTLAGMGVGTPAGRRTLVTIGEIASTVESWPGAAVGDTVTVFGATDASATTLAERIDTVGEEILTRLTGRIRRVVVD